MWTSCFHIALEAGCSGAPQTPQAAAGLRLWDAAEWLHRIARCLGQWAAAQLYDPLAQSLERPSAIDVLEHGGHANPCCTR